MVMAVHSANTNKQKALDLPLITLICAAIFLGVKYFEYATSSTKACCRACIYSHKGDTVPNQFIFFSFYFMMTGPARHAHPGRNGRDDLGAAEGSKGDVRREVLHAGGPGRVVLAPGRSDLDLPVPAAVPD